MWDPGHGRPSCARKTTALVLSTGVADVLGDIMPTTVTPGRVPRLRRGR